MASGAAFNRQTAQYARRHQHGPGLRRQLEDNAGLRGERRALGLDQNAARGNVYDANLGTVLEPSAAEPRGVLGAQSHLSASILRTGLGVVRVSGSGVVECRFVQNCDSHNARQSPASSGIATRTPDLASVAGPASITYRR